MLLEVLTLEREVLQELQEVLKVAVLIYCASLLARRRAEVVDPVRTFRPVILVWLGAVISCLAQGDFGAAVVFTSPPYGNQRDYTTGGIGDWDALMRGVCGHLDAAVAPDAQVLVNLGLIHRDGEWQPYWSGWMDWMRTIGWRRFGWYVWDQGPGLPGDWNGRLAPSFEFVFHFNRTARQANKIIPCRWAGHVNSEKGGLRAKDGTVGEWQHAGQGVQETRIPDSVLRITRHKARGIETLVLTGVASTVWMRPIMNLTFDLIELVLHPLTLLLR